MIHFMVDLIPNHVQIVPRLKCLICSETKHTNIQLNYFLVFNLLDFNSWFFYSARWLTYKREEGKKTNYKL